jgi:PAS domain S-box-containing protein
VAILNLSNRRVMLGPATVTEHPHEFAHVGKEQLFEIIIDSCTDIAIFTIDAAGNVTSWNTGAERLFGFSESEIKGRSCDMIFTPSDRAVGAPEMERTIALSEGRALDERWHNRKDGTQFWASGLLMPLRDTPGFVKVTRDRSAEHCAQKLLELNEQRFRLLATSIPQLVFLTRPDGDRTWGSPQWIAFTGLSLDESLGFGWLDAVHPEDRKRTQKAWTEARKKREYYVEHRIQRRCDLDYRWYQTRAKPVESGDGSSSDWIGTMTDIHDLRGMQDRQMVLMAELQHRTRNLLAVVQSIAGQTIRSTGSLEVFRQRFESRLRALSRVQSLLARSDHQAIELHALVESEIAAHGDISSERIQIKGPRVAIPALAAQTLGLALHELATNAVKYGALAQPQARLLVFWAIKVDTKPTRVVLEWAENNVHMPAGRHERKGYGSQLIERALPYQLGAKTALEFNDNGIRCLIEVPFPTTQYEIGHV